MHDVDVALAPPAGDGLGQTMNQNSERRDATVPGADTWVRESRFGRWFLSTDIWLRYVLGEAMDWFVGRLGDRYPSGMRLLDAGCGEGRAFELLHSAFAPRAIVGVDIDGELIARARARGEHYPCAIELHHTSATALPLASDSIDLIFCHQLLHHTLQQQEVLAELGRVLRPHGVLLVAESCRSFIESSWVRALFRHPTGVQHAAGEYLAMVASAGFAIAEGDYATTSPWWSRTDFGLSQWVGLGRGGPKEPTEVTIIATKPASSA